MTMQKVIAQYIWIDGNQPTAGLRSKVKVLEVDSEDVSTHSPLSADQIPMWGFDGSSTEQAEGNFSDCRLRPVATAWDPILGRPHVLVMCEVLNADFTPHASNTRAHLAASVEKYGDTNPLFGIEQEYTLFDARGPLGWPEDAEPGAQGPYYCGVGARAVSGRTFVDDHMRACLEAGLEIAGTNAEVMLGQWEYQIGTLASLEVADQLWLSRWLLHRVSEDYGYTVSLDAKPKEGDWNGAGAHANFSTEEMRNEGGLEAIMKACEKLANTHDEHIAVYGAGNEKRLTGKHETCSIEEFRYGVSDRGASIRIPMDVNTERRGYLEDRRPAANCDPYLVCTAILETVCGDGFKVESAEPQEAEEKELAEA